MTASRAKHIEILRRQKIDLDHPGTILRDFESVLDAFGTEGMRSTGKYHLFPQDRLFELDARLARPLRPNLKRPQQRSFPHLNGLYLLLRATRLAVPQGMGKTTGRLVVDQAVLDSWRSLNFTEQYFNLLEAWLLRGRDEMIGEAGRGWTGEMALNAMHLWTVIVSRGQRLQPDSCPPLYGALQYCTLALMELFGLAEVDRGEPAEGASWRILAVRPTPFGEAISDTLLSPDRIPWADLGAEPPEFGYWQPLLQECFPEWRNNLQLPEPEFRDGVYYFKVRLGDPWRVIAIAADHTLEDLAWSILKAFKFSGDHLYEFRFSERDGSKTAVSHPYVESDATQTDEFAIGYLPLAEGQSMEFEYDFGAGWRFDVKLERVEPSNPRLKKPRIVESHGAPPKEYDDDDYDED